MMPVVGPYLSGPFDVACQWCQVRRTCDYRIEILRVLVQEHYQERFVSIIASYRQARTNDKNATIRSLAEVALSLARTARPEPSRDAVWCAFVHLWHGDSFNWGESFPTTSYQAFCDALDELEASPCAS